MLALHLVGRDEVLVREHAGYFGVERVECSGIELRDFAPLMRSGLSSFALIRIAIQDVIGMRIAPGLDRLQAGDEADAGRAEVDVRDVHHFEPRLRELGGDSVEALTERARTGGSAKRPPCGS